MTLHSTQKIRQSKWPTFRWLGVGLSCLSLFGIASQHSKDTLHLYHTRKMAISGLPLHVLHPQTDLPQLHSIVIPWPTQLLLPKSSLVISVPIQVPIVLCSFSWEVMNKYLFTLDKALMTDQTNNSTLV